MTIERTIETDILIIGGGMAGFFAAIKAKEKGLEVTLVDKGYPGKSGATHFSEGDFTFFNPERGYKLADWLDQMNRASEYINNREWGEIVLQDSYERMKDLLAWGVQVYQKNGGPFIGHGGIHEHYCMIHREYAPALRRKAIESGIKVLDRIMVCELIKQDGQVAGAMGFHTRSGHIYIIKAKAIVIATGGTSLKSVAKPTNYWTADGETMAYRAGVEIAGKEFIYGNNATLRSEVKGVDQNKTKEISGNIVNVFVLYPLLRVVMSVAATPTLNAEGGQVLSKAWEVHNGRAPLYIEYDAFTPEQKNVVKHYFARMSMAEPDKIGFDPFKPGKVQSSPGRQESAQSIHGGSGIWPHTTQCATALPGLYAAGNSLASLISGAAYAGMGLGLGGAAVTGARAGLGAADYALKSKGTSKLDDKEVSRVKKILCSPIERVGGFSSAWVTQVLQGFAVPYFILHIKHEERMQAALTMVEFLNRHLVPKLMAKDAHEWRLAQETKNMGLNVEMILRASIFRKESRGTHYREDYPRRDDPEWLAWIKIKDNNGVMTLSKQQVPKKWWPDLSKPYEELYPKMFPGE